MASISLDFVPPTERSDIVTLHIFEAPAPDGAFAEIDSTSAGLYPNYITRYTTDQAISSLDWFAIQWEDNKGATTDMSAPIQGGSATLVGEIINQVQLREPNADENVILLEALAAIEVAFPGVDPFSIQKDDVTYRIMSGLVFLAQARSIIAKASGSGSQWAAGIVSMKSDTGATDDKRIDRLLKEASMRLGLSVGRIYSLAEPAAIGGYKRLVGVDLTRAIVEYE